MGEDVISVENLVKRFSGKTVLHGISFSVKKGEIVGFLGPNGAGKTTTMRVLSGYLPASSGRALIDGMDIAEHPREAKRRIGYLPETPPLYPEMTVEAYLAFVAALKQIPRAGRKPRIDEAIEHASLGEVRKRIIGNLSRGFRQRVGLAQALVHDPEILILDEPTSGLDPKQIIEIRELIKGLRGGHTIILSTHILPEATLTCERVVIINEGKLMAVDSIDSLSRGITASPAVHVAVRRNADAFGRALAALDGVRAVRPFSDGAFLIESGDREGLTEEVARVAVEGGYGLLEMHAVKPDLEEIFLRLTSAGEAEP